MKLSTMLASSPVIAVLTIEDVEHAVPLARALLAGGLPMMEVELTTDAALAAIERIAGDVDGALVGVCDVITAKDLKRATKAGARFASTPGFTARLSDEADIPLLPGVATGSDIMRALEHGHTVMKLFPIDIAGGIPALKTFAGVFRDVSFVPAGGVTPAMATHYLAQPNVACVAGSWVTPERAIRAANWEHIQFLARDAASLRRGG